MLALFALWLVVTPPQVGSIHVLVEPGDAIFLDGRQVGVSSPEAGGFVIEQVPVGQHEVVVRSPSGGSATAKVVVNIATTSMLSISSLGLRLRSRGDDSTIEVQVTTEKRLCDLEVSGSKVTAPADELRIEHVRPGQQKVTVTCGGKQWSNDLEIPAGKIVTLAIEPSTRKLHVIDARDRITTVVVPTIQDKIMRLDLPFTWKRAIAASIIPGVRPTSIGRSGSNPAAVDARFTFDNYSLYYEFTEKLKDRPEVSGVYDYYDGYSRNGDAIQMTLTIAFRTAQ